MGQDLSTVGGRLLLLLKRMRISQAELARRLEIPPQMVTKWVKDRVGISEDYLRKIAEMGGVTVAWLRYGEEARPAVPEEPAPDSPAAIIISYVEQMAGFRRASGEAKPRDMVSIAYELAARERLSVEEYRRLDAWRDHLLGGEA